MEVTNMLSEEMERPREEMLTCGKCGSYNFRVYVHIIIDDAKLYCAECGTPWDGFATNDRPSTHTKGT